MFRIKQNYWASLIIHDLGVQLVSTGGTFRELQGAGLPAIEVSSVTEFPEIMDGRVKIFHPQIHGGILGRRSKIRRSWPNMESKASIWFCEPLSLS